ncbi:MAG: hypothetical protein JO210_03150 [Acidobacteriaceae bacterium]|nr:hypothetical protein [Acidobacteriaceae bacterium]
MLQSRNRPGWERVARNRKTGREQLTGICLILYRNAYRDRLMALEAGGGIEVHTLLAAVQSSAAFRAVAFKFGVMREADSAVVTSRSYDVLDQARKLGARYVDGKFRALRSGSVSVPRRTAVRILIAVLPIFAISVHSCGSAP